MALKQLFKRNPAQTAVKGRSPALIITIAVHVILLLIAGTFVAVTVVQRSETKFECKQIVHPKMKLKKLQVPVKIDPQVKRQAPSLSQRVTANARSSAKSADFKMPDVAGFGAGTGVDLSGASLGGSLGFASTQINLFGLRSRGEKIVFLLDTDQRMLVDNIGGIPAYKIIKNELINLIGSLPPTALFNVIVFAGNSAWPFSNEMSPASHETVEALKTWLAPLNSDKRQVGLSTLPAPRQNLQFEPLPPIYNRHGGWMAGLTYAVQKGADCIYWLGTYDNIGGMQEELWKDCERGKPLKYASGWAPDTHGGMDFEAYGVERWQKLVSDAKQKHKEENDRRLAKGQPARVLANNSAFAFIRAYFPSAPLPNYKPGEVRRNYTGADVIKYIEALGEKYSSQDRRSASIGLENKKLKVNVIHFVPVNQSPTELTVLPYVAREMGGDTKQIQGLAAIEAASSSSR